ncbi:transmembrane protein, putative (macronuclear) [Tetrahymena thermophila SB210]|uniref:Transmembrane protein, putative n=1 Tax=Tetrahymena thermophila (strain SB210) TaxID=312017 RepID=I7MEQ9_TETTS|nr:transmembrane protein, putative [Tetrahymena thermophila SB210]EAR97392.1 transmembrane protein, putative [Tetrahymena thermophila SB210]|eukprot:XP_001017637.1 transmembrane protein, putative [Tetrahymena thermophila SB210]
MNKKVTITFIFTYLSVLNGISCISSVSLPLSTHISDNLFIHLYERNGCLVNFVPDLNYCSNAVKQPSDEAIECGAQDLGRSPFYSNAEEFASTFSSGNIKADLNFSVLDNYDAIPDSQLCFINQPGQVKNDNIIDQLFSQGLIDSKKFYIDINNIKYKSTVGSIDIGNPNYYLIKKGQGFTTLKPYTGNYGYYASSNGNMNYGNLSLYGYDSVSFSINDPYIQIPEFSLKLILQDFKRQGIAFVYQPDKDYALYVKSIQKLKNIQIDVTAEDGSSFSINLKPQQYSRKLADGAYELLLYPTFYNSNLSIGYAALQAYYIGFDFIEHTIYIAEKSDNDTIAQ